MLGTKDRFCRKNEVHMNEILDPFALQSSPKKKLFLVVRRSILISDRFRRIFLSFPIQRER